MTALAINSSLRASTRLRPLSAAQRGAGLAELASLVGAGFLAAAASVLVDLHLRVPGHAILIAVLPLSLGLALVPRQLGGAVMGCSAAAAALGAPWLGMEPLGAGALTSLCLTGPMLDAALWRARPGWSIYLRFALAGLATNVAAFAVRGGAKLLSSGVSGRALNEWLSVAPVSYALCGLAAGLISAVVWFRWNPRRNADSIRERQP